MANNKNRYAQLIQDIFFKRYKKGDTRVEFIREDIEKTAKQLDIKLPKNLGDVIYSFKVCTSPVYGNRLSDHHEAKDKSKRYTYRHCLGRKLDENNSGKMQWGLEYRKFHIDAWAEVFSVLKRGGLFILNISDHVRKGEIMPVSEWHKKIIIDIGFTFVEEYRIETPRMRYGENYRARVGYENLFIFKK
jgi:hypothetical protein